MATRSLTIMKADGKEIAVLYRQYDGYPTGMGKDIVDCLRDKVVVNGYSSNDHVNGGEDMAIQLISYLKLKDVQESNARESLFPQGSGPHVEKGVNTPGQYYLYPAGTRDCAEEYIYDVDASHDTGKINLKVYHGDMLTFEGNLNDYVPHDD